VALAPAVPGPQDGSLVARMRARLADVALLAARLAQLLRGEAQPGAGPSGWICTATAREGQGIAAVQTARGLLTHVLQIQDDQVSQYVIIAPTEWNFHPDGVLRRTLEGMAVDSEQELRRRAALLATLLDPCVPHSIQVYRA